MPGVTVNVIDAPAGPGAISDTGKVFAIGLAAKGSTTGIETAHSMAEFITKLGARQSWSYLYDFADVFFHEGGQVLVVARAVGPAALPATLTLKDTGNANVLIVNANSPGTWGNGATGGLSIAITHPTTGFAYQILFNGVTVESSPEFFTVADAIAWAAKNSTYVVLSDPGGTNIPVAITATNLASGADDRTNVSTPQWQAALDRMPASLGPGQICAPGITTLAVQQAVINHAADKNRIAILDGPNSVLSTDFSAAITGLTGEGRKHAALVGPWAIVPGLTNDTQRTVPYSAIEAGIIARNDGDGAIPNVDTAPAGDAGYSRYATGLTVAWDKTTRDTLNTAGVTPARIAPDGRVQTYGDRTLANITTQRAWLELSSARLFMYVVYEARVIGEGFVFAPLDAASVTINRFAAELKAFLVTLSAAGMIDNDPQAAVDTGPSVNTQTTKSNRQLLANITVQPAEAAEDVVLNVAAQAA